MYPFKLRAPLLKGISQFCERNQVSVFHVLFAAFVALLHRYSGEERLPIGMVTAGRNRAETESLLGYFLNTVVVPVDVSGNPSFRTLVHRARNWSIDAMDHSEVPFEQLIRQLGVQRDQSRNPLFQALFSLEPPLPAIDPQWRLTQMDVDTGTTKYDLYLELDDRGSEVLARFHYSTDLFGRDSIARMAMHWKTLLRNGIANPDRSLSDVPLLNPRERRTLVRNGYAGATDYPKVCIHELFEQQAERNPDAIAVISEGQSITYRTLNQRANQVANLLLKRGLPQESLVGLSTERGLTMMAALLGILKAGAAYVPLDPRLPDDRVSYLLADSKPAVVITDERSSRPQFGSNSIVLDAGSRVVAEQSTANPRVSITPRALAYVMYTSGSTGKPKGVAVEHRSVVNLLNSMQQQPGITSNDILLAVTTLSFDIAGLEIFLPLITGARLVLAGSRDAVDGTRLTQLLEESEATLMQATPASWRMLIEAGWRGSTNLKILCGGEAISRELAEELMLRSASVWNVYGPTETTIWSSLYRLGGQERDTIAIGRPIANTAIYVVDNHGSLVPCNVSGEIYIGGDGLARGYLNRPELTAQHFVPNWLPSGQSSRLYRTGDVGRWNNHGQLEYLGRTDTQIKLRGMRIELGEVESVLASHPQVRQAVVTVKGEGEQQKLSAFLVAEPGENLDARDIRGHIRSKLPEHMLPAEYWQLETIPLLPSGKVNRAGLATYGAKALMENQKQVGPRNEGESQLATIWSELLKIPVIGVDQNFFDLGGHSLLVLQMVARIRRTQGVELPARSVFEAPTIAALAQEVEKARTHGLIVRSTALHRDPNPRRSTQQEAMINQLGRFTGESRQDVLKATSDEKPSDGHRI
jgi:amino acid adenylation domain-containing protein